MVLTASHVEQVSSLVQTALVPSLPWQYEVPLTPGQHGTAPTGGVEHVVSPPQQMSLVVTVPLEQVPGAPPAMGAPVHVPVTQLPEAVSQMSPPVHCESSVHLPHTLGVVGPHTPLVH